MLGLSRTTETNRGLDLTAILARFCYCAIGTLKLLQQLDLADIRLAAVKRHLLACQNDDGGFGLFPGAESHAGQTFCSLASLAMLEALAEVDQTSLLAWLLARQQADGGLNGRPEKVRHELDGLTPFQARRVLAGLDSPWMQTSDSCYSWWVGASLAILQ